MNSQSTGIVRNVDQLGRIVLPKELRDVFGILQGDGLEIFMDDKTIILKKYAPACVFCNNAEDVVYYRNKGICENCLEELTSPLE